MSLSANQRRALMYFVVIGIMVGASTFISIIRTPSETAEKSLSSATLPFVSATPTSVVTKVASPAPKGVMIAPTNTASVSTQVPTLSPSPSASSIVVPKGTSVTTAIHGGKQTVTSKTNRVKVSVKPIVSNPKTSPKAKGTTSPNPTGVPVQVGLIPNPAGSPLPSVIADWSGYIEPTMTWDGWISCVRSSEKMLPPNGDGKTLTYVWTLTGRVKITGGHYILMEMKNGEWKEYQTSMVSYSYADVALASDTLPLVSNPSEGSIKVAITVMPMNWDTSHPWESRLVTFSQVISYSQGSCGSVRRLVDF